MAGLLRSFPMMVEVTISLLPEGLQRGASAMYFTYELGKEAYKQPITLTLRDYPEYIRQPYRIRIK